ncbi:MAG: hypothetical protein ACKOPQ_12135 [Novosphingobium sp.]
MIMKTSLSLASVFGLAMTLLSATPALAENATASAGVNGSCDARQATIVIPPGRVGTGLGFDFRPGQSCGGTGEPDITGFDISRGNCRGEGIESGDVYTYERRKLGSSGRPPISTVTLPAGTYCLSFNGGRFGYVQLNYSF